MAEPSMSSSASVPMLALSGVSLTMKGKQILKDVTLEVARGSIVGFRGSNGSGKTMLLRLVAGLVAPTEGSVVVNGVQRAPGGRMPVSMGVLIGSFGLWEDLMGRENLRLLAALTCKDRARVNEAVDGALRRVGLDPGDARPLRKYSLGMRQRLGIAQAIMEAPDLILLDEPTNALDGEGRERMHRIVLEEQRRGATVLIVSHDQRELDELCCEQYRVCDGAVWREAGEHR